MAMCAVCGAPCRGKCGRCGARLCVTHRPSSTRAKCAVCKRLPTGVTQAVQAIPAYPAAPTRPMAQPRQAVAPLATLALSNQLAWIADRRVRLQQKQQRERRYLNGRAALGIHTSTDEEYEADALLEHDLLEALDLLETCLHAGFPASAPGSTSPHAASAGAPSMLVLFPDDPHGKLIP
ncbi:MAG TPA: hypothetical protein VFV38_13365 [Ktedonobacteraceae bacterium]|nr:hypothetical protein [Ktedonobacteraceae bacterium]